VSTVCTFSQVHTPVMFDLMPGPPQAAWQSFKLTHRPVGSRTLPLAGSQRSRTLGIQSDKDELDP